MGFPVGPNRARQVESSDSADSKEVSQKKPPKENRLWSTIKHFFKSNKSTDSPPITFKVKPESKSANPKMLVISQRSLFIKELIANNEFSLSKIHNLGNENWNKACFEDLKSLHPSELKKQTPKDVMAAISYCKNQSNLDSLSENEIKTIHDFFSALSISLREPSFFSKMKKVGYDANKLFAHQTKLQEIISPEIKLIRKEFQLAKLDFLEKKASMSDEEKKVAQKHLGEIELKLNFHRGALQGSLNGNRFSPAGGGVNGALFYKSLEGEKVGVFKPHPITARKSMSIMEYLTERFKDVLGMEAHLNQKDKNKRVRNEVLAYEAFHIFGFDSKNNKLPTTLEFRDPKDNKGRFGSFCAFMDGVKSAEEVETFLDKTDFSVEERHIWEMSKIFDFLVGNLDGAGHNAFVRVEDDKLVGTVNFDHDKAFAVDESYVTDNQYEWSNRNISKFDFTDETKNKLKDLFSGEKSEEKIQLFLQLARKGDDKNLFTEQQETLLRNRIAIIQNIYEADSGIKQLAAMRNFIITTNA